MLTILLFITLFSPDTSTPAVWKPAGCDFFTKANAVRIIGTDVTWTGTDSTANEPRKWTCTFVSKDAIEGPKLHFVLHRFAAAEAAREEFDSVVNSNKNHSGFERWKGVGDDAIVHTDGANFQLVMVRKGVRSFRIKVNPAGSTSLENVKLVAQDLIKKMEELEGGK
jgi:hypothetical protein